MIYTDDFFWQQSLLKELNALALSYAYVEGNLVYNHLLCSVDDPFNPEFFEKRFNLFQLVPEKKSIMEIGFNAGHSALIMLLANPAASYTFFDLNSHSYTEPCFQFLKRKFLIDLKMVYGDSGVTVPGYVSHTDEKFDLIHVDGSHELAYATRDFENSRKLSTEETVVIFDDTTPGNHLDKFLIGKEQQGIIKLADREVLGLKNTCMHTIFNFTAP